MYHSKIFVPLLCLVLFIAGAASSYAAAVEKESDDSSAASAQPSITARSAVLIDADSGTVLFENNADEKLPPASVTKVMTMLLIMEAVDSGKISLDDKVTISERSASMRQPAVYGTRRNSYGKRTSHRNIHGFGQRRLRGHGGIHLRNR